MDITVSPPDEIVDLYMYHFCLSIENSNDKSVRSELWTSDDRETSNAPLISCWDLVVGGFILWGIGDWNITASYED